MQRFLPKTLNQWLLAVAALSLPVGWLFGYGLLGAGLAFTLLCVAGARSALPRQSTAAAPQRAGMAATPARVERTTPSNLTLVEEMLAQGRTALLLRQQIAQGLSATELQAAQDKLDDSMAMVPEGQVSMRIRCADNKESSSSGNCLVRVEGLFLDRYAVTNREYRMYAIPVTGLGFTQQMYGSPRWYGVTLGYEW